jgi:Ser/Thr protein kinase RdoA (MazF antagonist)
MKRDLGQPIALGRTAEIYAWDDGWVLKLFYAWFSLEDIQFEQRIARLVLAAGLPVPEVGEILQVNERNGLLYERVDDASMREALEKQPLHLFAFARGTAELHTGMHTCAIQADLPSQHARLERKILHADSLPAPLKTAALNALACLPDGDRICHGDFHPDNILLAPRGAVDIVGQLPTIIDWIDASRGNSLADLARTTIIILGAAASDQIRNWMMKALVRLFHALYLRRYFQLRPGGADEYRRWLPVVAAARLSENIPEMEAWLLKQAPRRTRHPLWELDR